MDAPDRLHRATVLVVDDEPSNLLLISEVLADRCHMRVARGGEEALRQLRLPPPPDLVLLDVMMPGVSGWDVCRAMKADPLMRDVPVVFLTALSASEDEERALEMGAADFISKPIRPSVLRARVRTQLENKAATDFLRDRNAFLDAEVQRRVHEVAGVKDATIEALAALAETRDPHTGNHVRRTQHYVRALALHLQSHPRFAAVLTERTIDLLFKCAPLHDIGKVGIPDGILLKPGPLTPEEYEVMKEHARLGREALASAERHLGFHAEFLTLAQEIAYSHHERWDGSGYPQGLAGEQIPVSARLMAVADVYDALSHRRVYRDSVPPEQATATIARGRGTQFDPDVADAAVELAEVFERIARRFGVVDSVEPPDVEDTTAGA